MSTGSGGTSGTGTEISATATTTGTVTAAAGAHVPVLHLVSSLPTAVGDVPKFLRNTSLENQRSQADELFTFLSAPAPALTRLNEGTTVYVAVVNVPKTSLVKIVYGMGFGSSPIGVAASPVDKKILFMYGDGNNDVGPPQALCLPPTMVDKKPIVTMTELQFSTQLTAKGVGYTYPLLPRSAVTGSEELIQIAPIPAYLVYDGFEQDLDAACVLERVLSVNPTETDNIKHLKKFLRACLSAHNSADNKPYVSSTVFSATATVPARQWAKQTFERLFPPLAATSSAPPPGGTNTIPDIAALVAAITAATRAVPPAAPPPATSKTDDKTIAKGELATMLRMCGRASTGTTQDLPGWLQECNDKGITDSYRYIIVQKHIMSNTYFDEAEVPLTLQLIKMIVKRAWTGKDGNINRPSLIHAMEGLTPFAMLDLNEDQVAHINDELDLLNRASQVSVADLRGQRSKLEISIPWRKMTSC